MKTILKNGAIEYRNEDGEFHREDGPAIIFRDIYILLGTKMVNFTEKMVLLKQN